MSDQTFIVSVLVAYQLGILNGIAIGLWTAEKVERWLRKRERS